jgi:hypothetical protein
MQDVLKMLDIVMSPKYVKLIYVGVPHAIVYANIGHKKVKSLPNNIFLCSLGLNILCSRFSMVK